MDGSFSMHGTDENCVHNWLENLKVRDNLECLR